MRKLISCSAVAVLLIGVPLIWRAWPRALPPEPLIVELRCMSGCTFIDEQNKLIELTGDAACEPSDKVAGAVKECHYEPAIPARKP